MNRTNDLRESIGKELPAAGRLLCDLIRIPSTSGNEHQAMVMLSAAFRDIGLEVEELRLSDRLRDDPDYSDPIPDIGYEGRFNLRITRRGRGDGRRLLLNTHVDVVPPSVDQPDPWNPRVEDRIVHGRGACDAKGQVATIYLIYRVLRSLGADLAGDILSHVVVEEENGGNGTLAMVRNGENADGCVVLEPSSGKIFTSIRGAVWFRLVLKGKAGHSGQAGVTRSALLLARDAIGILEQYHADLLERSRGLPLFDSHPNPMPITFGSLEAGNWPASAPSRAILQGVLGLLPNVTKEQVCGEMRQALEQASGLAGNFDLSFMYRHDSCVVDPSHELPQGLLRAAAEAGLRAGVDAMTASCDAWFYANQLRIPTVVYGPGSLQFAHSKDEQIALEDISDAAGTLVQFILNYCR